MNYYQILIAWTNIWEELLKEPNELLLNTSFVNLAQVANAELEHHIKNSGAGGVKDITINVSGWKRKSLEWINDSFQNNEPIIDLLKLDYSAEMSNLEPLIQSLPFEPLPIQPLVRKIKDGLTLQTIEKTIGDEINKLGAADTKIIALLTEQLLRRQITKFSQRAIKEILPESLLREGTSFFLKKNINGLIDDEKLNRDTSLGLKNLYGTEIQPAPVADMLNPAATSIYNILKKNWEREGWIFLSKLDKKLSDTLQILLDAGKDKNSILTDLRTDANLHKEIGTAATHPYAESFAKSVLRSAYENLEFAKDTRVTTLATPLSEFLSRQAKMKNNRTWGTDFSPNLPLTAREALGVAAAKFFAEPLSKEIVLPESLTTELGLRICSDLASALESGEIALPDTFLSEQLKNSVENWSARRILHRGLKVYLQPLTDRLCSELPIKIKAFDFDRQIKSKETRTAFWQLWIETFVSFSRHYYKDLLHYLPWSTLNAAELKRIISGVFSHLTGASEKYVVTLLIKGLTAQDKRFWNFDDVSFFDPADYNFGESRWFGTESEEKITRARLFVEAETKHEAGVKAWLRLHEVLNSFGLNLGADHQWGGFDLEVNPQVFTQNVRTGDWNSETATTTRQEKAIEQSVGVVQEIARNFENLLRTARDPAKLSDLQRGVLSAFYWYQKGRWKKDPAESYIFYWIGIESVFGEDNRDRLFKSMGRLLVTWREIYGFQWTALRRMQDELQEMIEADADLVSILSTHVQLNDWNTDVRVLLNLDNANFLLTVIPAAKFSIQSYAENFRDFLKSLKDNEALVQQELEKRIERFQVKLLLLKNLRNAMTHEGIFYRPEMLLYNEELENIFEKTLVIVANEIIQPTPFYNDLAILIGDSERPFIS